MNVAVHVLNRMIDDGVIVLGAQSLVGWQFIGENCSASFHMLTHLLLEFGAAAILYDHGANFSTTLQHSHDHRFVFSASASDDAGTFAVVHVAGLASDESFVNLNFATGTAKFARVRALHRQANPLQHEPCRLLGHSQSAVHLP